MVPSISLPRRQSDTIVAEDQIIDGYVDEIIPEDACSGFLQCFQPSEGCWSTFTNFLCDPFGEEVSRSNDENFHNEPVVATTAEEISQLDKILKVVTQNYSLDQELEEEKKFESSTSTADHGTYFLLELAKAGASFSLEAASKQVDKEKPPGDCENDPEAKSKLHRELGKQKEKLKKRRQHHVKRAEILIKAYPNLLRQPFESFWFVLEHVLEIALGSKDGDDASTAAFRSMVMESWLGSRKDVFDFLLGLDDVDDKPIYNLIKLCFHLSVAHAFLTVRDIEQQEKLMKLMDALNEAAEDHTVNPAIQAMFQDFQSFQKTKPSTIKARTSSNEITAATATTSTATDHAVFLEWYKKRAPGLLSALPLCMRALLFPNFREETTKADHWLLPFLDRDDEGSLLSDHQQSWLFALACTLPPQLKRRTMLVGDHPRWNQLYLSNTQGFDMKKLERSLAGYEGPTLLLVEAFDKETKTRRTFGAFASKPWVQQPTPNYYGNGDSFLFELKPNFRVLRAKPASLATYQYFQYYYIENATFQYFFLGKNKDKNKPASGLGLGGNRRRPRFFISASLDTCYFGPSDSTFEEDWIDWIAQQQDYNLQTSGDAASVSSTSSRSSVNAPMWKLLSLEIWGVGGESAIDAEARHRILYEANLRVKTLLG